MQSQVNQANNETKYVDSYKITRSLSSFKLFNVVAVDKKGNYLGTLTVDMEFEDAAEMLKVLNKEEV